MFEPGACAGEAFSLGLGQVHLAHVEVHPDVLGGIVEGALEYASGVVKGFLPGFHREFLEFLLGCVSLAATSVGAGLFDRVLLGYAVEVELGARFAHPLEP